MVRQKYVEYNLKFVDKAKDIISSLFGIKTKTKSSTTPNLFNMDLATSYIQSKGYNKTKVKEDASKEKSKTDEWNAYDDDESPKSQRVGKQNGKAPRDNQKQNKQVDKVARDLKLNNKQRRELHDAIGHQGYGYKEVLETAEELFLK